MSVTAPVEQETGTRATSDRIINDFSIQVATVNGSGSQTANLVLLRSIFQMGIPVSGKNMFPSNIAGLPTWYTVRANKDGYIARKREVDFLVAMNAETAKEDVLTLQPGRAVLYDEPLKLSTLRSAHRLHEAAPDRQDHRQGDLRDRPGGRRDRVDRDGARRRVGGRARHDVDLRPGDLTHERVRRPRVLRGSPGRDLRHPACGAVDGPPDADRAGGHRVGRPPLARGHEANPAHTQLGRGWLLDGDGRLRPGRALPA